MKGAGARLVFIWFGMEGAGLGRMDNMLVFWRGELS
jgi:hypothetical protein